MHHFLARGKSPHRTTQVLFQGSGGKILSRATGTQDLVYVPATDFLNVTSMQRIPKSFFWPAIVHVNAMSCVFFLGGGKCYVKDREVNQNMFAVNLKQCIVTTISLKHLQFWNGIRFPCKWYQTWLGHTDVDCTLCATIPSKPSLQRTSPCRTMLCRVLLTIAAVPSSVPPNGPIATKGLCKRGVQTVWYFFRISLGHRAIGGYRTRLDRKSREIVEYQGLKDC